MIQYIYIQLTGRSYPSYLLTACNYQALNIRAVSARHVGSHKIRSFDRFKCNVSDKLDVIPAVNET